jgi:PAS domain S-box-containing protein
MASGNPEDRVSYESLLGGGERLRLLVESVEDYAIFVLDPQGHVETWNKGAQRIKGYATEEIVGRHFSVFYPPEDVASGKCEHELEEAGRGGRFEDEGWRVRKDGSRFWANVVITALRDKAGRLVGFAKVTRDLTERVQAEAERVRLARAEERERRTHEFLAIMGHELRNPLAPMVLALHKIKASGRPELRNEYAVLERQLAHMTRLVDDLLDVTRSFRDRLKLRRRQLGVNDVVTAAVEMVLPLTQEKGQRLAVDVAPDLHVDGDFARLVQVVGNLVHNAAKYTPSSGRLSVHASREADTVCITVEDDGQGIDAELLPRVFELFTQADQGLERHQGGLGIGLSIARALAEAHGGTLTVESPGVGRGTKATLRLPFVDVVDDAPVSASAAPVAPHRRRRVLVVDDNADSAEMMCELLGVFGHETRMALDGHRAVRIAEQWPAQVVFLDIGLPGLSGYEVAAQLRQMPGYATVPIIAVSGYVRDTDRAQALQAGFSAHLAKPVDPELLRAAIEQDEE